MIPKTIHYCWFGGKSIPDKDLKCIESWKRYCPDYEIVQWNESNYDVMKNQYMQQAYKSGKWAFVSDFARLDIIYHYGGLYFDTDVEIVRNIDGLLENSAFMGFEDGIHINPGLGFGAEKDHSGIKKILAQYENRKFKKDDGSIDMTSIPVISTQKLVEYGAVMNDKMQTVLGITLYPSEFFCPKSYDTGKVSITSNTYSVHHFNASWKTPLQKKIHKIETKYMDRGNGLKFWGRCLSLPFRIVNKFQMGGISEICKTVKIRIKKR